MKNIIVCSIDGYAFEIIEYLKSMETGSYQIKGYLEVSNSDVLNKHKMGDYLGSIEQYTKEENDIFVIGTMDMEKRDTIISIIQERKWPTMNIIHSSATISPTATIGTGNIIGPNCLVMSNIELGSYNVFNYNCSIGHDSVIGENNVFSSNCHLTASIKVLDNNFFGTKVSVIPDTSIGNSNRFQAGITVDSDIKDKALCHTRNINKVSYIF